MKQVILDGFLVNPGDLSWAPLEQLGELTFYPASSPQELVERMAGAQAVYVNRALLTREVLAACPTLKYIGCLSTGYNMVDLQAANELGITVTNVPSYSTHAVAQFTIGLLLEAVQHIGQLSDYVKAGRWVEYCDRNIKAIPLTELYGKTLGIVGMGEIGSLVARIAIAMGMRVLAYRRNPDRSLEGLSLKFVSLDELLAKSHVVSLHCPLTPETTGMVNEAFIAKMMDGAVLLNTARGAVVDEQALSAALDSGKLAWAAVDVLSAEPPEPSSNPLLSNPRCTVTPHVAWTPKETRQRLIEVVAANTAAYLAANPQNVVNSPAVHSNYGE